MFSTIPLTIIESGDPVIQELWETYVKDNQDDHEGRIVSLESGSNIVYPPYFWQVSGPYETSTPLQGTGFVRVNFNTTVLAGRVIIKTAGTGGSTQVDFLYKRGAGAWTSIFTSLPSVAFSAGNYAISTNGILNSPVNLLAGDLLRMDITTSQGGDPQGLLGLVEYQRT